MSVFPNCDFCGQPARYRAESVTADGKTVLATRVVCLAHYASLFRLGTNLNIGPMYAKVGIVAGGVMGGARR